MSIDPISQEIGSGDRPRRQETTLGGADAQTRFETASKRSSDPPLSTGHTIKSREDMMEQKTNLIDFVPPTPHDSPLSEDHTPRSDKEDKVSGEKGGSTAETVSTARPDISAARLDISAARPEVSTAKPKTPPITTTLFDDEDATIADTLVKIKSQKAKEKGVAFRDVEEPSRLTRDQGLAQIESDADLAQRIYEEELTELDRVQKERQKQEEATIAALTKEFDEIQARMDVDHELSVRMTHKEQEMYTIKVRGRLLARKLSKKKETISNRKSRGNKEQTTYKNSIQEQDDYLPQTYGMLKKFNRQDLVDLHRLVMKRFKDNTPKGYNLLLWGDLKCTTIAYDPNPLVDDSDVHPLKEYKIKFTVMNGKKSLTLDFKTFFEATGLDYNKGTYVSHPSHEAMKGENIKDKDSERFKPLIDMESFTSPVTTLSRIYADYQVNKTQSTRFEVSVPDQHQGKTFFKVELDTETLLLTTVADIQDLLKEGELIEKSNDDIFEAEKDMDEDI
nr:hypothetical protein [Tanacetum cinerariifolium]